ncbi:hypothetical protein PHYSODRAFT_334884 [Phytophthora sojae]|uniref:Uncharacterized protein n=1 Tax=Phytophthora sojae (strain P6497) TaxID=1094619 RepID=G4ZSY7_PHYSP|nr:hypothetical protein PHYSODRAFT_334884 [Phytophthora sojae]EGZ13072.1 hypothetical protein PHYSODRAFT_334884 [Phytophthora sojae]|eukprot:XP_009530501.1 hypothetical protein PHYSODRAFT_334884 [Phytophthora sojae]
MPSNARGSGQGSEAYCEGQDATKSTLDDGEGREEKREHDKEQAAIMGNSVGSDGDDEYDAAGATGGLLVGCASSRDGDGHEEHGGDDSAAISVSVEPPLLWHTDWAAWKIYLAEYCERTKQVLPVKETLYNYQLLTFMAMNEFGEGAVVQQSLLEAKGDWHMEKAIAHFKRAHPTRINLYLKEMRSKSDFGKISSDDASQVDAAIHKMVYAASEEDYKATHKTLKGLCERIGLTGVFEYFEKNWDSCQDRWVMYRRADLPHFNNHTNNRLESFFGKFKDGVDSSLSMAMCVKALVAYERRMQNEYQYRLSRIGQFVNSNYDEEMSNVLRFTTHDVAKQIEQQYARAMDNVSNYTFRKDHGDPSLVVVWTNSDRKLEKVRQFSYEKSQDANSGRREQRVKTHAERYREAVRATHLIATEMADIDDESEFMEMLQFVLNQWRNGRQRKIADFEQFKENGDGFIDTVQIKDVGNFSRMQIETFKKVQDLKESVQLGVEAHRKGTALIAC